MPSFDQPSHEMPVRAEAFREEGSDDGGLVLWDSGLRQPVQMLFGFWKVKLREIRAEGKINANLCIMPRFVIVLSDAFTDLACRHPDHRIGRRIVIGTATENVYPQSSRRRIRAAPGPIRK